MATGIRSLDIAQEATMSVVSLNNKVISMRPVVRRAKLFVSQRIICLIKKLENKRGTPEQVESNRRKAERLLEEVKVIRRVRPDKVSKYALSSTDKFDDVCRQVGTTLEAKALCRLSLNPGLQKVVTEFREQHYDWKSLAAYLLTKETGRKYKTKKQKNPKIVSTNITASKALVHTYLSTKLGKEVSVQSSNALTVLKGKTKHSNNTESEFFEIDQSKCSEIDQPRSFESNEYSDEKFTDSEQSVMSSSDSGSGGSDFDSNELQEKTNNRNETRKLMSCHRKNPSPKSGSLPAAKDELIVRKVCDQEEISNKLIIPSLNSLQESSSLPIMKSEMVVERVDLNHHDWNNSVKKESELSTFLLQNPNEESKDKKIWKDSFFTCDDDDSESGEDDSNDAENEHCNAANLCDNNKDENETCKSHFRKVGEKSSLWSGKRALESIFVGSLSDKKSEARQNFSFKEKRLQNRFQGFEKDFRQNSARSWAKTKGRPHQDKKMANISRPFGKSSKTFSAHDGKRSHPDFKKNYQQKQVNKRSFSGKTESAKAAEKEVLHPSWQAKKIKKEQEKIIQFQGKKIIFEDD